MLRDDHPKAVPTGEAGTQVSSSSIFVQRHASGNGIVSAQQSDRGEQSRNPVEIVLCILCELFQNLAETDGPKLCTEPRVRQTLAHLAELMFDGHGIDLHTRNSLRSALSAAEDACEFGPMFLNRIAKFTEATYLGHGFTEEEFVDTRRMMDNLVLLVHAYVHLLWHGNLPSAYWEQFREPPPRVKDYRQEAENLMSSVSDDVPSDAKAVIRHAMQTALRDMDRGKPCVSKDMLNLALRWTGDFSQPTDIASPIGEKDDMVQ